MAEITSYDAIGRNSKPLDADPTPLKDGDSWVRSTAHASGSGVMIRVGGVTVKLADSTGVNAMADLKTVDKPDGAGLTIDAQDGAITWSSINSATAGETLITTGAQIKRIDWHIFNGSQTSAMLDVYLTFMLFTNGTAVYADAGFIGSGQFSSQNVTAAGFGSNEGRGSFYVDIPASTLIEISTVGSAGTMTDWRLKLDFLG